MKTKLVELHYSKDYHVNYLRDRFDLVGRPELETRWYIKRVLFKKVWFFWDRVLSQTLRMETNQAIHAACFGTQYNYNHAWDYRLLGTPDKIIYR